MEIKLSDRFNYRKLMRFTLPSIMMMIFTSIYGIVDGYFVSNFVGKTAFSAVNFIMPTLIIFGAVGSMFGNGGSALVSKTLGEGDEKRANKLFSLFIYTSIIIGTAIAAAGFFVIKPLASFYGASGEMLQNAVLYSKILLLAVPAYILQYEFQSFFVTAERPKLGLLMTVVSGVLNMVLDAVLVAVFDFGIAGAAVATAVSQYVGGFVPLIYFFGKNKSLLHLTKTNFDKVALFKASTNGMSEFLSVISMSVVGILYNYQLMKYAGENGVAAYGTLMYVNMVFIAVFLGYSLGIAPVVGYHYGAKNTDELKNLLKKSAVIIGCFSVLMLILSESLARPLSLLFVGYDKSLFDMTHHGFLIFSFSFLFVGVPIFGSSFFTALNNGMVSAAISFFRTLVFEILSVLILPIFFGLNGIWFSVIVAEVSASIITVILFKRNNERYKYY